jgi:dynamin 1-like protein
VKLREVIQELLARCYKDAKKMMEALISFELAYINTNHPDFIDVGAVLSNTFKASSPQQQPQHKPSQPPRRPAAQPPAPPSAAAPLAAKEEGVSIGADNILGVSTWFTKGVDSKSSKVQASQVEAAAAAQKAADFVEEVVETKLSVKEWLQQGLDMTGMRLDPREHAEMELVVTLIVSYFDIVRKNLRDALPKATMHLMVNQVTPKPHP